VSTPHILYACLGGFIVFVCYFSVICYAQHVTEFFLFRVSQFGMFSLFIREKAGDHGSYPNLPILTTVLCSSTLAKPAGPFFLASSLVSPLSLYSSIPPPLEPVLAFLEQSLPPIMIYHNTCHVRDRGACTCLTFILSSSAKHVQVPLRRPRTSRTRVL